MIEEYGDLIFQDQLTAMGSNHNEVVSNDSNHVWVHIMERFLFHKKYRTADGMKYEKQDKKIREKAQKFIDLQTEFYDLSFEIEIGNNERGVVAFYSQEVGQRIAEAYKKMVSHLAHLDNYFLDDPTTINNYITSSVFPHIDFGNSLSSWITMARRVKLDSPFLEAENLENLDNPEPIDQIIRLVCMFKEEWYEQIYPPSNRGSWKKSLPDNNNPLMEMMSNQRGYLPKDLPKFPHEAVIPYKAYHRQVSSRPDSLPIRDISLSLIHISEPTRPY